MFNQVNSLIKHPLFFNNKTKTMKTEYFNIPTYEQEDFIFACNKLEDSIKILKIEKEKVYIEYKHAHNLFYLGQMFMLKKQNPLWT